MRVRELTLALALAAALAGGGPAAASQLIGFTDTTPDTGSADFLSDTEANLAVSWTQTVDVTNMTVRALLTPTVANAGPANWYITTALGAGATAADVVASGSYEVTASVDIFSSFNGATRTDLVTGLDLAAGSYFLVLDGSAYQGLLGNAFWVGTALGDTVNLAPGFTLGTTYRAVKPLVTPDAFAPASGFLAYATGRALVFELEGGVVPEPATWGLMIAGFGLAGVALRRRRPATA